MQVTDIRNAMDLELPLATGGYFEHVPFEVWGSPEWCLEPKEDGLRASLQLNPSGALLVGRNRQDKKKGVAVAGAFRDLGPINPAMTRVVSVDFPDTILDGELTERFNGDGEWTEDTKQRADHGFFVGYTAWTVLVYKGMDVRSIPEHKRFALLQHIVRDLDNPKIRTVPRLPATRPNLQALFSSGMEGGVLKHLGADIPTDTKRNPFWLKCKGDKNRTVDAVIIGVTEGKSGGSGVAETQRTPDGTVASFTIGMVNPDGLLVEVGKMKDNLPEDVKQDGFVNFGQYEGRVVELVVSGWDGKRFRYPRFVKWRTDKTPADCLLADQIGPGRKKES